jgi:hypothetical protein
MSFKVKEKSRNKIKHDTTLQAKLLKKNEYFNDKVHKTSINKKKLKILNKKYKHFNQDNTKLSAIELEEKLNIQDEIKKIKDEESTYNENESIEYLLDTGDILFNYFDKNKNSPSCNKNKQAKKVIVNNKSVIDYFNNKSINESNKMSISEEYHCKLDGKLSFSKNSMDLDICDKCNVEKIVHMSQGKLICPSCGDEIFILIDSDKPSYKEPPREICYFAYKRINHFNEWLAQFQAKESTDIPTELYDAILLELKKERVDNMETLSPIKVREILKKLKQNKYYEHVAHIINKINGKPPPIMNRKTEEELRRMFKKIQIPFYKHCPRNRKNFLSYSYVLHKFVQLLELDDFLDCFLLLKSREKLHQQDIIWKKICEELKWEFIPSV